MSDDTLLGGALVLMLAALPLVSIGAWNDTAWLWSAGLVVLAVGSLIPPVARYAMSDADADDESGDESGDDAHEE